MITPTEIRPIIIRKNQPINMARFHIHTESRASIVPMSGTEVLVVGIWSATMSNKIDIASSVVIPRLTFSCLIPAVDPGVKKPTNAMLKRRTLLCFASNVRNGNNWCLQCYDNYWDNKVAYEEKWFSLNDKVILNVCIRIYAAWVLDDLQNILYYRLQL